MVPYKSKEKYLTKMMLSFHGYHAHCGLNVTQDPTQDFYQGYIQLKYYMDHYSETIK